MITEEQILSQRRKAHRHVIPKGQLHAGDYTRGVKWQAKEKHRANNAQREQARSEQHEGVTSVATAEIVIEQTEAGGGNFYEFEPDVYEAIVANIEQVDNPFEEDKTQLQFTFDVPGFQNEDGTTANKRAWANPVWNQKSKLYGWAAAILGKEPTKGEPFRASDLIGQPCRIVLNSGKNSKGEDIVKITDVLGPPKAAKPAAKKPNLAQRLAAEPPKGATVVTDEAQIDYCATQGCEEVATIYTSRGTPFCETHAP